ncbi:hypothetical protein [uncultured Jannaschia sp.]|uniref:hypothetical protein n=1 Tax=uncultured Jannaschia sp. TaxID=293347 RepID=UPI002633DF2F|nr:hypothetical protein [uncultured Jannaschia sp.]
MTEFNLALTIVGAVVLILGLVAGYVKNRLLRRLPWWWLLGRWLESVPGRVDLALLGWFGPIGVASIY